MYNGSIPSDKLATSPLISFREVFHGFTFRTSKSKITQLYNLAWGRGQRGIISQMLPISYFDSFPADCWLQEYHLLPALPPPPLSYT